MITSKMIRKPIFWTYYLITVLFGGIGLIIINHCSPMLTEGLAMNAGMAALVISITSISNGVSRFIWGMIFDKMGVSRCLSLIAGCFTLASIGLCTSFSYHMIGLFVISACLLLFSYGGNAITCPSVIRELFGHRTFSLNYSVLATDAVFTSCFPSIAGVVQVATQGYQVPLIIMVVVSMLSILTVFVFSRMYYKQYEE